MRFLKLRGFTLIELLVVIGAWLPHRDGSGGDERIVLDSTAVLALGRSR